MFLAQIRGQCPPIAALTFQFVYAPRRSGRCDRRPSSTFSDPFGSSFSAIFEIFEPLECSFHDDEKPGPPYEYLQKDVLAAAWEVFGPRFPEFETLSSIFSNTGIVKRYGVKPFEWYLERRGWPERTEIPFEQIGRAHV